MEENYIYEKIALSKLEEAGVSDTQSQLFTACLACWPLVCGVSENQTKFRNFGNRVIRLPKGCRSDEFPDSALGHLLPLQSSKHL